MLGAARDLGKEVVDPDSNDGGRRLDSFGRVHLLICNVESSAAS
jgi:hypothetical protein